MACNKFDTQIAVVEIVNEFDENHESSVRLYDVGRRKGDKDETDEDDDEEDLDASDDDGSNSSSDDNNADGLSYFYITLFYINLIFQYFEKL